ncbi:protein FAM83D [Denticeps clupeoides]|uniref:Scaffolding anchor of CK1 domain-containing protein n=1 Tax=Denticeps clupeoides TaxID=299321 RepID=A0AAY4CZ81_9TELE|nr:protein FAM83D-like [Denticeps clupeoides]
MALSQSLEDSPGWRSWPKPGRKGNAEELYNERHRLALEALVAGGRDSFTRFLRKENIPNFLSDEEIQRISRSALVPKSACLAGDEAALDQSVCGSVDCSSVTYFPDASDVEPPLLELGWPAFTAGSFRGVTRAVAHFQPSYGESIYSCKEAARKMIKSAKEVIAIVTDSLTDLDIFRDLQEACSQRRIPVYVLLDKESVPYFLQMCTNLRVRVEDLQLMRVRTITGSTYYMRSGAKITGKVHERFMLVDGNKVATGSYRFNWTDGKLNSSNLIELTGQITENFDEEFRVLYAQSLPINSKPAPPSAPNSQTYDHLYLKPPATPPHTPRTHPVYTTSTPTRVQLLGVLSGKKAGDKGRHGSITSNASTIGEEPVEQDIFQEEANPGTASPAQPVVPSSHISTQTLCQTVDKGVQTDVNPTNKSASSPASISSAETSSSSESSTLNPRPPIRRGPIVHGSTFRDCFQRLSKERHGHYASIRSKLDHMVDLLTHRRELGDLTNLALGPALQRSHKLTLDSRLGSGPMMENMLTGTWPRSRYLQ